MLGHQKFNYATMIYRNVTKAIILWQNIKIDTQYLQNVSGGLPSTQFIICITLSAKPAACA